ncbi:hypothetical protein SDC9_177067 [bioreactor metagenome]|uniref:Uncharacterized protein n=1 Tax=bioreactor metagenome TaxID=1076179 RepID=A0A645GZY8_9ZZZZ
MPDFLGAVHIRFFPELSSRMGVDRFVDLKILGDIADVIPGFVIADDLQEKVRVITREFFPGHGIANAAIVSGQGGGEIALKVGHPFCQVMGTHFYVHIRAGEILIDIIARPVHFGGDLCADGWDDLHQAAGTLAGNDICFKKALLANNAEQEQWVNVVFHCRGDDQLTVVDAKADVIEVSGRITEEGGLPHANEVQYLASTQNGRLV